MVKDKALVADLPLVFIVRVCDSICKLGESPLNLALVAYSGGRLGRIKCHGDHISHLRQRLPLLVVTWELFADNPYNAVCPIFFVFLVDIPIGRLPDG